MDVVVCGTTALPRTPPQVEEDILPAGLKAPSAMRITIFFSFSLSAL